MSTSKRPGLPAHAKLWIASLDKPNDRDFEVRAQYNPKELQIDKQIPWGPRNRDGRQEAESPERSEQSDLEFNSAEQRTMQIELLFDGFEQGESVYPDVERLERLSSVSRFDSDNQDLRRPHHCVIVWGGHGAAQAGETGPPQRRIPPFCCVIESLSTKYSMWSTEGGPLRATCTIKVKEAVHMARNPENARYDVKGRSRRWNREDNLPIEDEFEDHRPDPEPKP